MKVGKVQHEGSSPPSQQHRTNIGVYNTKKVRKTTDFLVLWRPLTFFFGADTKLSERIERQSGPEEGGG
jgi:hypothetical protein